MKYLISIHCMLCVLRCLPTFLKYRKFINYIKLFEEMLLVTGFSLQWVAASGSTQHSPLPPSTHHCRPALTIAAQHSPLPPSTHHCRQAALTIATQHSPLSPSTHHCHPALTIATKHSPLSPLPPSTHATDEFCSCSGIW